MSFRSLAWVFFALLLVPATARAGDKVSKETLEWHGGKRTYYLFVPGKAAAAAPLVVLLHGSGQDGLFMANLWKGLAAREGFVLAAPDSNDPKGWRIPADGPEFIHELVEAVRAKQQINARRLYLFGHSAGAVFALSLSMMESEYFAAAAVHAGAWRRPSDFELIRYAKRKTPLSIFVGDEDEFFPLDAVRATASALKAGGFEAEVKILNDRTHSYAEVAPDVNRGAWRFLSRHELGEEPRHKSYNFGGGRQPEPLTPPANISLDICAPFPLLVSIAPYVSRPMPLFPSASPFSPIRMK
jgi:predicted esterase